MPKVKYVGKHRQKQGEMLMSMILGRAMMRDEDISQLARAVGVSPPTMYSRKTTPGDLKYSEIIALCKHLDITIEELREAIRY